MMFPQFSLREGQIHDDSGAQDKLSSLGSTFWGVRCVIAGLTSLKNRLAGLGS